ncbi:MAG: ABC transporter substrate-binding protein [Devosia sp.]
MGLLAKVLLGAGLAAAMTASTLPALAQEPTTVRIGWLRSSLSLIMHPIAVEEGFYAKNGINPVVTEVRSGDGGIGTQSVMTGDLDIYIGVVSDVAKLNSQAKDIGQEPPLVVAALGSPGATNLVLRNSVPFETIADIKGLRIGVSSLGSAHLVTFRHYLAEQNTSVEDLQLQLVRVGGSDMPAALVSNQIDGFLHSQPTPAIAVATGEAKLVLAPSQMGTAGTSPNVGIIASRKWAAENGDTLARVVKSLKEASAAYGDMPVERVVEIAVQYLGGEPATIAASHPFVDPRIVDLRTGADTYWSVEMSAMKERGEVAESFEQADMFDFEVAQ